MLFEVNGQRKMAHANAGRGGCVGNSGRGGKVKEVKAEVLVGLSQGRHQRLGPARNLKAIFLPLAQETRGRMVTC
jgi:hypothetical protein